jgi:hypothetical protein
LEILSYLAIGLDCPQVLVTSLPTFEFTEEEFRRSTSCDLHSAVVDFADRNDLLRHQAFAVCFSGQWGGLRIIQDAREFLRTRLLATAGTIENIYTIERRFPTDTLRIGLHIRRGDFQNKGSTKDGRFYQRVVFRV